MDLRCPKCGSGSVVYAGTSLSGGAYGATDARYSCKECGYSGPLVLDVDARTEEIWNRNRNFRYTAIFILAIFWSVLAIFGLRLELSAASFAVCAVLFLFLDRLMNHGAPNSVEEDLEGFDEGWKESG